MGKRVLAFTLAAFLTIGLAGAVPAAATDEIQVVVDGNRLSMDVMPVIIAGRTLVPVRAIFEALGATVEWDAAARAVRARHSGRNVTLTIGAAAALVRDMPVALDVPAQIVNGRTLVPLRFVGEALGAEVGWDGATRTVTVTSPAARLSPVRHATRDVTFRVQVPAGTPADAPVYLLIMPFTEWTWTQHVALQPEHGDVRTITVALEEGALVRYAYDQWNGRDWGNAFTDRRESAGNGVPVASRLLLVAPDLRQVEDVIAAWPADLAATPANDEPAGTVSGTVVDVTTGQPLMDTNVSIGGVHLATDYAGRFRWHGVAAGRQRITVHRDLGDYLPGAVTVTVPAGGAATAAIALQRAEPAQVRFAVQLPDDTPPEAEVRLVGSVFQTGARPGSFPNQPVLGADLHLPVLTRVAPHRAEGTLDLHAGTYVQYFYSIGSSSHGREHDTEGQPVYRGFVVDPRSPERRDAVAAWRQPGARRVTLRLSVPPNTTPGAPIALQAGPTHWMTQTGPLQWTFYLHDFPGHEFAYRFSVGDDGAATDATPGLAEGRRKVVFPETDTVLDERVERWTGNLGAALPAAGRPVSVTFRVTVPADTPPNAMVRLMGADPAARLDVGMSPQPGNPYLYEASVSLDRSGPLAYRYVLASGSAAAAGAHAISLDYDGQVVNDWVTAWNAPANTTSAIRPGYIAGMYTPDFWSPGFLALSPGTYKRIREHHGNLVAISSVWSYGQTQPLPEVESRRIRAGAVNTPLPDLNTQARMAEEQGLDVMLAPQFNMEMSPGGSAGVCRNQTAGWWRAWLAQAERLWLWHARVAAEMEASILMLPGPCFHVFGTAEGMESPAFAAEFDQGVNRLMEQVRQMYRGKIMVSGGANGFTFPRQADLVGVTTFDTGHPDLPHDATVAEWRVAYDRLLAEKVDPIRDRWGKPVLFYTVHLPPLPGDPDASGQAAQARRLEGFFQALKERPWVVGTLSWAYGMVDAHLTAGDGVRARPAEAVLAKYYGLFTGRVPGQAGTGISRPASDARR